MKRIILVSLALIVLFNPIVYVAICTSGEIDATTVCSRVIDGDTFDTTTSGRIRLADVDAPESGEPGYHDAKNALIDLIDGKTVYLDIDDVYNTDPYGRLVCVAYVEYSSSHYTNVNKALLVLGVAVIKNYANEFDPYSWVLTVPKDAIPEFSPHAILPLFIIATLLIVMLYRKRAHTYSSSKAFK